MFVRNISLNFRARFSKGLEAFRAHKARKFPVAFEERAPGPLCHFQVQISE